MFASNCCINNCCTKQLLNVETIKQQMRWLNVKHNFTDNQLILMIHTIMPRDSWITSHITSEWEDTEISSHKWQNESKTGQACKARELRPEGLRQREVLERWQQASPSLTARGVWGFLYNFWPADDPRWPQFSLYSVSLSHHTHHVMTSHTTSVSHNMWGRKWQQVLKRGWARHMGGPHAEKSGWTMARRAQ